VSAVTVNGAGAESTPALFVATPLKLPPPALEPSNVTYSAFPVCVVEAKPARGENV
jgi:hypothetical protein